MKSSAVTMTWHHSTTWHQLCDSPPGGLQLLRQLEGRQRLLAVIAEDLQQGVEGSVFLKFLLTSCRHAGIYRAVVVTVSTRRQGDKETMLTQIIHKQRRSVVQ